MYSEHYEILVNRLVVENNKIRNSMEKWNREGNLTMIETGKRAHDHNEETIKFIKELDKEIEKLETKLTDK